MSQLILFSNNAKGTLSAGITNVATSATLTTGDGAKFASPTGSQYEMLAIANSSLTAFEVVKMTARTTDTITITRAQEGTTGVSWPAGSLVIAGLSATVAGTFPQLDNGGNAFGTTAVNLQSGRTAAANVASGTSSIAIGYDSKASATDTIAIGDTAQATTTESIAIGKTVTSSGTADSIGIGKSVTASGNEAIGIGTTVTASSADAIAIGKSVTASTGADAIAIGNTVNSTAAQAIGIGKTITASGATGIAIGNGTTSSNTDAIAIGNAVTASATQAVGIGKTITASGTTGIAVGNGTTSSNTDAIAIGNAVTSSGTQSIGIGKTVTASGTTSVAVGNSVTASATDAIAIGNGASAAIGSGISIGKSSATSVGTGCIAIGDAAVVDVSNGTALGKQAIIHASGSTALGYWSRVNAGATDSAALGTNSRTRKPGELSTSGVMPSISAFPDNWQGSEAQYYAGLEGIFVSEPIDLTGGVAWSNGATFKHGRCCKPSGGLVNHIYQYYDNAYPFLDSSLGAYTGGTTGGVEPTWGTVDNGTTNDNGNYWVAMNKNQYNITLPASFVVTECGVICFEFTAITVDASVSMGINGNLTKFVNNQALTNLTAAGKWHKFVPTHPDTVTDVTFKIDTLATGTKLLVKFYWKGFYNQHWL